MKAAWYERQGPADDVLVVGEMDEPIPAPGEVRIRVSHSGISPGDVKKRGDTFAVGMPYPRVVPHSDGAGVVDRVGEGVASDWLGRAVWCFGAQSYRPFGTAAEYTVVPVSQALPLADTASFEQAASIGIPGITAHRAVHAGGPVEGKTVLVQGGAGAVGACAVHLARRAGARVLATVRSPEDAGVATAAGAEHVVLSDADAIAGLTALAPSGIDHIVEVAFGANIAMDSRVLKLGGSIATYASNVPEPTIPFWPLVFDNIRIAFLGSDDFSEADKAAAAREITAALDAGWTPFTIAERFALDGIAKAHEAVEQSRGRGRILIDLR